MPCHLSVTKLLDILAAVPLNLPTATSATSFSGITTDSRAVEAGNVFLALRGEKFDGHDFAKAAIERGAIAVIADERAASQLEGVPQLQVKDTLWAYQQLARWWRDQFDIPVIAVTGSVGKTTTKELIAAVLSTQGKVLKSQANYNNEIGVPKTLLELDAEHDYAVLELAMRGAGQIALLAQIARPTVSVITNVGTAHIGLLGSREAIAKAKCELLAEMPATGIAVLNADNPLLLETAERVWQGQTLTYGLEKGDLRGRRLDSETLEVEGLSLPLPLPGCHNASNYLAALAVAKHLGRDWMPLTQGLSVSLPTGRSQRYTLPNDLIVLDETYNAGLESMLAALHLLAQTPGKRHIAILGTMKELGEQSAALHQQVGRTVEQLKLDRLVLMVDDPEAGAIASGVTSVPTECFSDRDTLVKDLSAWVQPGDRLLFKASRSVGLDRVVQQFREVMAS
jgi:UDP-N-acetylmuramoyl-tripeptide--D-alanyl-D-alanine ligase